MIIGKDCSQAPSFHLCPSLLLGVSGLCKTLECSFLNLIQISSYYIFEIYLCFSVDTNTFFPKLKTIKEERKKEKKRKNAGKHHAVEYC